VTPTTSPKQPFDVLIAGGGVAALEGALALRDLGGERIRTTLLAPDASVDAPLAVFGDRVSVEVGRLLTQNGITTITSAHASVPEPGQVTIHPGDTSLRVDRVVSLPQLSGPSTPGVPGGSDGAFIPVDVQCRVRGLENVLAAGDATDFPVKFGGIAAQQADTAAETIASMAGAPVEPHPFHPVLQAILLGADKPLYVSAHVTGGHGSSSEIGEEPRWSSPVKIVAKYLAPFLQSHDRQAV
jgi:sulfide:quinone oxidoreductase